MENTELTNQNLIEKEVETTKPIVLNIFLGKKRRIK